MNRDISLTSHETPAARAGTGLLLGIVLLGFAPPVEAQTVRESDPVRIVVGSHERLTFDRDVRRVAVGDEDVMSQEALSSREILVLGKSVGRTTLIVWFDDGTLDQLVFSVERDLSTLREALEDIHPAIVVEAAPDRDAVVLRGVVPDKSFSNAAEAAARVYLTADERNRPASYNPLIGEEAAGAGDEVDRQLVRGPEQQLVAGAVINLIRVKNLPPPLEDQVQDAVRALVGADIDVRRVIRGDLPDDQRDVFLLSGRVPNQVALTRALTAAARIVFGDEEVAEELLVIADESGARIPVDRTGMSATQGAVDDLLTSVLRVSAGAGVPGFSSSGGGVSSGLFNLVGNNLARAKVIQLGDGRLLSFIEVDDLPQVRVDIRVVEINRTRLLTYDPNFAIALSDFDQSGLLPAKSAVTVQGAAAASVGASGSDIQNVISFLGNGLGNQLQLSGDHIAIDVAFNLLEQEGLARTLANPSITVLSGELAAVQVGGTIPVPVAFAPAFNGSAETIAPGVFTSVEALDFGISLAARPMVGDDGTITLDVVPRTLFPDPDLTTAIRVSSGSEPPTTAFRGKSLRTTARLDDGQAFLIGGLVSRSLDDSAAFTPWLHDLPLIGWLFQRFRSLDEEMELIIVVHPKIVRAPRPEVENWAFEDRHSMLERIEKRSAARDRAPIHQVQDPPPPRRLPDPGPRGEP